jgi:hypothetical protein
MFVRNQMPHFTAQMHFSATVHAHGCEISGFESELASENYSHTTAHLSQRRGWCVERTVEGGVVLLRLLITPPTSPPLIPRQLEQNPSNSCFRLIRINIARRSPTASPQKLEMVGFLHPAKIRPMMAIG